MGKALYNLNATTGVEVDSANLDYDNCYAIQVDTDGSIYAGTSGIMHCGLIKYNSSFVKQWDFDYWEGNQYTRSIFLYGDHVYIASANGGGFKLDKTTGELITCYNVYNTDPSYGEPELFYDNDARGIAVDADYIYLIHYTVEIDGEDRNLTIFDHDGLVVDYRYIRDDTNDIDFVYLDGIAIENGNIYLSAYAYGASYNLAKFNSDIEKQWEYLTSGNIYHLQITNNLLYASGYSPYDQDGHIGILRVFNLDGVKQQTFSEQGNLYCSCTDAAGNVYVAGYVYDTDPGYTATPKIVKYNSTGIIQWTFNPDLHDGMLWIYGYGICLNNAQTNVICGTSSRNVTNVTKYWHGNYEMRYDNDNNCFKVNEEDDVEKTDYLCKKSHWQKAGGATAKRAEIVASIENNYYNIDHNPSLDGYYTFGEIATVKNYYPDEIANQVYSITKLGEYIYGSGWIGVANYKDYDNLFKVDLDLTHIDSIKTDADSNERHFCVTNDGTYIYCGANKCKKYNTDLELQWEFDIEEGTIRNIHCDNNYIYVASNRANHIDDPSHDPYGQYGQLWKVDSDGQIVWGYKWNDSNIIAYAVATDSAGNVYVGHNRKSADNYDSLTKFDSDGNVLATYDTGNYVYSIYINSNDDVFAANFGPTTDEDANVGNLRKFNTSLVNQWTINTGFLTNYKITGEDNDYVHISGYSTTNSYHIYNTEDGTLYKEYNVNGCWRSYCVIPFGDYFYIAGEYNGGYLHYKKV